MTEKQHVSDLLEPEVAARLLSRREAIRKGATMSAATAAGLKMASVPVAVAALAKDAFAQGGLPQGVVSVLNFALLLEYLEAEFYDRALAQPDLIPADVRDTFERIREHERDHVEYLRSVLGMAAIPKPQFDYTAGRGSFNGPLTGVFDDYQLFLKLSQAFEDTGASAYKTGAVALINFDQILTAALRIHSVEARHAAIVRRIRGVDAWITGDDTDIAFARPVYAEEAEVVQAGVNVAEVASQVPFLDVTESFDEPLSIREVYDIIEPFHC